MTTPKQIAAVTDTVPSAMPNESRNEIIEAEALAAADLSERDLRIAALFGQTPEEAAIQASARILQRSARACPGCKHVFSEGDIVFRRRLSDGPGSGSWRYDSYCLDCAAKWHPSWMEQRKEPVECEGACGVLVTSAYWQTPTTCSLRCSEAAAQRRRRVLHDERECVECHAPFLPVRKDARYCSTACRMRAYRRRRAA